MTFPKRIAVPVTNGITTLDGSTINGWNVDLSNAIDGGSGGSYAPLQPIYIGGLGIGVSLPASGDITAPWPIFGADPASKRPRTTMCSLATPYKSTSFSPNSQGSQQASATGGSFVVRLSQEHDGATLVRVILFFKFSTGRGSMPVTVPKLSIARYDATQVGAAVLLNSGDGGAGLQINSATTVAGYELGGAVQAFTYNCDQNNVIDHSKHILLLSLTDESGGGAQSGNLYGGAQLAYSVADMRWP